MLYVSKNGRDDNPGTKELPFQTISAAQQAARKSKEPVTVEVMAGSYRENLVFDERDSGDTYLAKAGAILTGGVRIPYEETKEPSAEIQNRLSKEAACRVRVIDLKHYGVPEKAYEKLYAIGRYHTASKYDGVEDGVNLEVFEKGSRMQLARYPSKGWLKLAEVGDIGEVAEFPPQNYWREWEEKKNPRGGLYFVDEETNKRIRRWQDKECIWMAGYFFWDWADSSTPVSFLTDNRALLPAFVSRFGARKDAPYYFYNVLEELDTHGEYWLDREKGLLYVYPGQGTDSVFEISVTEKPLLTLDRAENLTVEGFTLTNVRDSAVKGVGKDNVFRKLQVKNAAKYGFELTGYGNLVEDCEISDTGWGGIYLTGGDRPSLTPGKNIARNNRIHDFAQVCRTYQAGVSLSGVGNCCEHNEIYNAPHMAIFYEGNEHVIEYNYLHEVVLHSGDAGAIYSGFDWAAHGTVIRYNRIRNVGEGEFAPNGIYWDDGLSGQTAYGNLLENVKGRAFLAGGGRDNTICDNVIVGRGIAPICYDDRNRQGFFYGGWAKASCNTPEAPHFKKLAAMPYTSSLWKAKYPSLANVITDFSRAKEADFPVNPAHVVIQDNHMIIAGDSLGEVAESVYEYNDNEIGPNYFYASEEEGAEILKRYREIPYGVRY